MNGNTGVLGASKRPDETPHAIHPGEAVKQTHGCVVSKEPKRASDR